MMAKTEALIMAIWAQGLRSHKQYLTSDDAIATYMELRTSGQRRPEKQALILALVKYFGFKSCGFMHDGKTMYYNPWHQDSPESKDDSKLVYPVWIND